MKTPAAYARPVANSSHPRGFPGRFHASKAPTVEKAPMNTTPNTQFAALLSPGTGWAAE
ncbi:MAG TPA: hypothetical protein VH520_00350 [Streptosporangiaceae bacterium]